MGPIFKFEIIVNGEFENTYKGIRKEYKGFKRFNKAFEYKERKIKKRNIKI